MRFFAICISGFLISLSLHAQIKSVKVDVPQYEKGWAYESYKFPPGIKVYRMDKTKEDLKLDGHLTLIQLWSIDAGGEPEVWSQYKALVDKYKGKGLKSVSINFENGVDFGVQHEMLKKFFAKTAQPERFYFDYMGYSVDLLTTPGFPTYSLVDESGQVIFRTNGKDPEGMDMLRLEIDDRLNGERN